LKLNASVTLNNSAGSGVRAQFRAVLFGLLVVFWVSPGVAAEVPDYEREQRLADEAITGLFDGEVIFLNDGSREFLALYSAPEESEEQSAVILLHGRGFHPDWPQVVGPLRESFLENEVATLSLQMPVLEKGAKYYQYLDIIPFSFSRIDAGIQYLRTMGYRWIGIIAHSCSVHMTMAWIEQFSDDAIDAYVGIGMGATDYQQPMRQPFPLADMSVPVLDVFGSADYRAVLNAAEQRKIAMEFAGNPNSAQTVIPDADHFFEDYEAELASAILDWLQPILPSQ